MSKSLGNSLLVPNVLERVRGDRAALLHGRRRTTARTWSSASRRSTRRPPASAGSRRFLERAAAVLGEVPAGGMLCAELRRPRWTTTSARPAAVAAIHDAVREGNKLLAGGASDALRGNAASVRAMLDVLGLDPADPAWAALRGLRGRQAARRRSTPWSAGCSSERAAGPGRKDFAAADAIRDRIKAAGIEIEDTPDGPKWTRLMAGNSQRKGAIKKTGKGNPTAGSGGRVKRGLEGKGPTPKAKDRPNHKAYKERRRRAKKAAARPKRRVAKGGDAEWIAGRNSVVEALRAEHAGDRGVRRRGRRARRPAARGVLAGRRARAHPARGAAQRARPADRRRGAPGPRGPGAGVRVRPPGRPARRRRGARASRR